MARLIVNTNTKAETVFNNHPSEVKEKLQHIKQLILETANKIPTEALKNCIKAALTYHKVKHLATLGI